MSVAPAMLSSERDGAQVWHAPWQALLDVVPACDLLCVDAPYSERTHRGHDQAVAETRLVGEEKRMRIDRRTGSRYSVGVNRRRTITYKPWTAADVLLFVEVWHRLTRGWFVSITDHVLAPVWAEALEGVGRYVFAPVACVAPGSRVRLLGDGPTNWSVWLVAARPRSMVNWGALPGAYVVPPGAKEPLPVVGGKQPWMMERIIADYSRPGETVVDPCCGAGTTAVAAIRTGRRAIVGDALREHADIAARWIANPYRPAPGVREKAQKGQASLFDLAREAGR